jgi:hypothetical protein
MIRRHADTNPAFREALRREAAECIRSGDVDTGRMLRANYRLEDEPVEAEPAPAEK